ncbi:hypothetical protein FAIPA1_60146 [Frankia sp. AiPs1]|uniref:lasso peptide biosynthesis PqqD family chaperone n=1 Tax=Frankia sp. AiPa1 TaxID=573492 RepID=UPI00202B18C7|nr:lasso peptide biosynthesis PqqD family chaperone [Frankia sp. AiPa1]MCL9760615.1 lasso peptide biosynthesis PqqD family chaperone [Frankia sp. AiPa1]
MVTLRSDVVRAPTEYGAVLLHTDNGQYWTLNPSGDLVLRVMLAGGDVTAATRQLCATGAVDPETARRDVEGLLAQLRDVGLIDPTGDASGARPPDVAPGPGHRPGRGARHRPVGSPRGATGRPARDASHRSWPRPGPQEETRTGLRSKLRRRR